MSRWKRSAAAFSALVAVPAFAGCSGQSEQPVTGACLLNPSPTSTSVQVVDCASPHTAQVVGIFEAIAGPYPGADILSSESSAYCAEAFESFVGSDPLTSVLDLYPLLPSENAWDEGDTSVLCVASTFDDQRVSTSFENSHR